MQHNPGGQAEGTLREEIRKKPIGSQSGKWEQKMVIL